MKAVYRWAVTHRRIDTSPLLDLPPSEILKPRTVQHRAASAEKELPEFHAQARSLRWRPQYRVGPAHAHLTACMPVGTRRALGRVDRKAAQWTIPAERMKMREEHRVPLSKQALEVLARIEGISGGHELVFPSPYYPSKPLSEDTFNSALARIGCKSIAPARGDRAMFLTVANEDRSNPVLMERQQAHWEQTRSGRRNAAPPTWQTVRS
jgi:hypothetical protein